MKKIKVNNNLPEIIEAAKKAGFKYTFSPSLDVTFVIVDEFKYKIRFEYGSDMYDYEEVELGFFGSLPALFRIRLDKNKDEFEIESKSLSCLIMDDHTCLICDIDEDSDSKRNVMKQKIHLLRALMTEIVELNK